MGLNNANIGNRNFHQGIYNIKNADKYIGDPSNIVYRSSMEYKFCVFADNNPKIVKWGCETTIIPYKDQDGKPHRYFPDFYIEIEDKDKPEFYRRVMIEVKPEAETKPPALPAANATLKRLQSLEYQLKTYRKNYFKWLHAVEFCKARDMEFKIITEQHLDGLR